MGSINEPELNYCHISCKWCTSLQHDDLALFDEFSEKLDYLGILPANIYFSAKNRKLRLSFAKSMINNPEMYWNNVLFADESEFNIFDSDGRITVWSRKK